MVGQQALNAYKNTDKQAEIPPVKLIHMLYERLLVHLDLAEKGINAGSPKIRGENLSKVIAILTELNASVEEGDNSEAARFLRGLYTAILTELPKVSVTKDVRILQQARRYIKRLSDIWKQTAMQEYETEAGDNGKEVEKNFVQAHQEEMLKTDEADPKQKNAGLSISI